jgi:hypothetical protein
MATCTIEKSGLILDIVGVIVPDTLDFRWQIFIFILELFDHLESLTILSFMAQIASKWKRRELQVESREWYAEGGKQ